MKTPTCRGRVGCLPPFWDEVYTVYKEPVLRCHNKTETIYNDLCLKQNTSATGQWQANSILRSRSYFLCHRKQMAKLD